MTKEIKKEKNFYGRRKGKPLSAKKEGLLETLLPTIQIQKQDTLSYDNEFDFNAKENWLEIGFGQGHHLSHQAKLNPQIAMIGCEVFVNGVASLLCDIDKDDIKNIKIYPERAEDILSALPDNHLDRVTLLYPDPWPKSRHNKRRFVSDENLEQIHRVLKKGGLFRFASDIPDYITWTLMYVNNNGGFNWAAKDRSDWANSPKDWYSTKYEQKAIREGRTPTYLDFIKK